LPPRSTRTIRFVAAIAIGAVAALYLLRLDRAAGLMVDDAWYVLLARTLAEGHGYRVAGSPAGSIVPNYPPAFPAMLSLVFLLKPDFPANVPLLKCISMAAMLATGWLSYVYYSRHRGLRHDLAAIAAACVALIPAFVFLATSTLMTECVFTFAQLAAVVAIHNAERKPLTAPAMAALSVLIRSAGASVSIASLVWLLIQHQWKRAITFIVMLLVCLAPWVMYGRLHASSAAERSAVGGSIAYTYDEQFWMKWAGVPASGRASVGDLPGRIWNNLVDVSARDVGGIVLPSIFRSPAESGQEVVALGGAAGIAAGSMGASPATMLVSLLITVILVAGFVRLVRERLTVAEILVPLSLTMIALWPFWGFRFVLPLAPFLLLYFVSGVQSLSEWMRSRSRLTSIDVPRLALLSLLGLYVCDHAGYLLGRYGVIQEQTIGWATNAEEADSLLAWMNNNLDHAGLTASSNSALVYLRTGRETFLMDDPTSTAESWRERGVRYVVCLIPLPLPSAWQGHYTVLYQSPRRRMWVIGI